MAQRISAVVNTLNEERALPFALRSVRPWVDEIIVADMHSDDRTVEIARTFGAIVHPHDRTGFVEPARAFAVSKATGDWILLLDADEVVPTALSRRLRAIAEEGACDVVRLPMANWLLGVRLEHTGWGPAQDPHERFFRRGSLHLPEHLHARLEPAPGARVLDLAHDADCALVHFNYFDSAHFLDKLNRYTTITAAAQQARGQRPSIVRALAGAARNFAVRYWRRGGWRDGWRGFHLSAFMAFYHLAYEAKLAELDAGVTRESSIARYRAEAERLLAEYERPGGPPPAS